MIVLSSLVCSHGASDSSGPDVAGLFVLVEPPPLPDVGVERRARGYEAYLAGLWSTHSGIVAAVGSVGHHVHAARIANGVADPAQGAPLVLDVEDAEGPLVSVTGTGPRPVESQPGGTNTWQVTDSGLLHLEVSWSERREFGQGPALTCEVRAGSRVAQVLGLTSCSGETVLTSGTPNHAYAWTWNHFEGVTVGGDDV